MSQISMKIYNCYLTKIILNIFRKIIVVIFQCRKQLDTIHLKKIFLNYKTTEKFTNHMYI